MKGRSKFNVSAATDERTFDGITFDSALEMKYYRDVVLPLYEQGEIIHYEMQKRYILQPSFLHNGKRVLPIDYVVDFFLIYKDNSQKVIDIKGFKDPKAQIKQKLFWFKYPDIECVWIGYSGIDGGWVPLKDIEKGRAARRRQRLQKENKEEKGNVIKKEKNRRHREDS